MWLGLDTNQMQTSGLFFNIDDTTGEVSATSPKEENRITTIFNWIYFYIERDSG